ncbi:hypothetical protein PoB_001764100 [Plakobranchus ocellatus]|uniref:Uncharacterized protein n=1 Tax=Plakobranchus ocellatus TaxID=259542 RepID=A0AAV3Z931_9GAST|nr:hypothetical protein PoB_001764100 [Plakobranchus ocellatus]
MFEPVVVSPAVLACASILLLLIKTEVAACLHLKKIIFNRGEDIDRSEVLMSEILEDSEVYNTFIAQRIFC